MPRQHASRRLQCSWWHGMRRTAEPACVAHQRMALGWHHALPRLRHHLARQAGQGEGNSRVPTAGRAHGMACQKRCHQPERPWGHRFCSHHLRRWAAPGLLACCSALASGRPPRRAAPAGTKCCCWTGSASGSAPGWCWQRCWQPPAPHRRRRVAGRSDWQQATRAQQNRTTSMGATMTLLLTKA